MALFPSEKEAAARARASKAYAGVTHEELAQLSGVSEDLLRGLMLQKNPHGATLDRLYAIADACQVPRRFMDEGFAPLAGVDPRVTQLEQAVNELRAGQGLPPLPGDLGRFEPGHQRADEHRRRPPSRGEADQS